MELPLPQELVRVLQDAPVLRRAYLVGGCVRDALLRLPCSDYDVEVFGVAYEELAAGLRPFGRVDCVGRSFGVVKLQLASTQHDFSIPRRDSKVAPGHRGFEVAFEPGLSERDAASRRDFTINALMYDPRAGRLLDFFGGAEDLRHRRLRHTSEAFGEDPLRVLRGMHFAARFDLVPDPATIEICRAMRATFPEIATERVWHEWYKWATRSTRPSAGLRFLEDAGWLEWFPEVAALRGIPQEPEWHPEGDVLTHTAHALDALVSLPEWRHAAPADRAVSMFAVLAHDFGKAACTHRALRKGRERIVSPGHERISAERAASFLRRLRAPRQYLERVVPLVAQHGAHFQEVSPRAVRRLARRLEPETVERLCVVMTADAYGRPPRPRQVPPAVNAILRTARDLQVAEAAPRPVLSGRHLLEWGYPPGPAMGRILAEAFEAQLDGEFSTVAGAREWLQRRPQA